MYFLLHRHRHRCDWLCSFVAPPPSADGFWALPAGTRRDATALTPSFPPLGNRSVSIPIIIQRLSLNTVQGPPAIPPPPRLPSVLPPPSRHRRPVRQCPSVTNAPRVSHSGVATVRRTQTAICVALPGRGGNPLKKKAWNAQRCYSTLTSRQSKRWEHKTAKRGTDSDVTGAQVCLP